MRFGGISLDLIPTGSCPTGHQTEEEKRALLNYLLQGGTDVVLGLKEKLFMIHPVTG